MTAPRLKVVSNHDTKPKREYEGEPLECVACNNRNLIETYQPRYKAGRIVKGKASWLCPHCNKVIWP